MAGKGRKRVNFYLFLSENSLRVFCPCGLKITISKFKKKRVLNKSKSNCYCSY